MITGQLRSRIDKLWEEFWTGGITNPLTVIEQISFLMFARLLDMRESTEEKKFDNINRGKEQEVPRRVLQAKPTAHALECFSPQRR